MVPGTPQQLKNKTCTGLKRQSLHQTGICCPCQSIRIYLPIPSHFSLALKICKFVSFDAFGRRLSDLVNLRAWSSCIPFSANAMTCRVVKSPLVLLIEVQHQPQTQGATHDKSLFSREAPLTTSLRWNQDTASNYHL